MAAPPAAPGAAVERRSPVRRALPLGRRQRRRRHERHRGRAEPRAGPAHSRGPCLVIECPLPSARGQVDGYLPPFRIAMTTILSTTAMAVHVVDCVPMGVSAE